MVDPILQQGSQLFTQVIAGYRASKVLFVANKLGVFLTLERQAMAVDALAGKLGCNAHALELLLRALVGMGLVEKTDRGYRNGEIASVFLVPGKATFTGHTLEMHDLLWDGWSNLETVVRTGEPHQRLPELLSDAGREFSEEYIRGMLPLAHRPARAIASMLGDKPIGRLLDVGCGPAAYALALLERHPAMRATLFDLPQTLEVTKAVIAGSPLGPRIELRSGNYLTDPYGEDYDLVFMSHTTHDESMAGVLNMFERGFRALRSGGRLAVHDFVVDDESCAKPSWASLFSVNLMTYTDGGQVYSRQEYGDLLARAGFVECTSKMVLDGEIGNPTCLIVASKP